MLDTAAVRQAWLRARKDTSTLDAVLSDHAGISFTKVLVELGRIFHYPVFRLEEGGGDIAPALDVLGLPDCRRLFALVVTRDGAPVLLFVNPTDEPLQRWADAKGISVSARELVLESELNSLLSRLEGSASALPGMNNNNNNVNNAQEQKVVLSDEPPTDAAAKKSGCRC